MCFSQGLEKINSLKLMGSTEMDVNKQEFLFTGTKNAQMLNKIKWIYDKNSSGTNEDLTKM